jgi:hypothetical protein
VSEDQPPEAACLLHGVLLAVHRGDEQGVEVLLEGVPREILVGLISGLADVALAGWERAVGSADAVCEVIQGLAFELAAEGSS